MHFFDAIILGIVEGITEFLPVSSTGHLVLASSLLGVPNSGFTRSFEVAIQLGAILAVVVVYFRKFFFDVETVKRLVVAFLPSAVVGLALYRLIKDVLLGSELITLSGLFAGGVALIAFELWHEKRPGHAEPEAGSRLTYKQAFLVGMAQVIAVVPGVSRSGATIVGGLALGLPRQTVVEFSFLLAVPTMAAATGLDLLKTGASFTGGEWGLLAIGFSTAFFVALGSIAFLPRYVRRHTFIPFGVYRAVAAIVMWMLLYPGMISSVFR
jgi:undecaprenyl-diphosphatase